MGVGYSSTFGAKKSLGKYIIRVDADDFMSDFQDDWDEKVPLRASDVDRTEGMDW